MNENRTQVDIYIPCYNEAERLPVLLAQIEQLAQRNQNSKYEFNFTFLDDGSEINHSQKMKSAVEKCTKLPGIRVSFVRYEKNRGKGAVLFDGFMSSLNNQEQSRLIGFLDGDGATSALELPSLLSVFEARPEVGAVIGSRWLALGRIVKRSFKRHLSGRIFATILSEMYDIPIYDSQCGAKIFRSSCLNEELLQNCYDPKWLFDTKLVIYLYLANVKLVECPIDWIDQAGSKVSLLRDSWRMFIGLWHFRAILKARGLFPASSNRS